jgi:hypothetical protein
VLGEAASRPPPPCETGTLTGGVAGCLSGIDTVSTPSAYVALTSSHGSCEGAAAGG